MNSFTLNADSLLRGLKRVDGAVKMGAERGLAKAGMELLRDATMGMPTVPLDEGTLRGSGSVIVQGKAVGTSADIGYPAKPDKDGHGAPATSAPDSVEPGAIVAVIGFNTPYAARLHEHPEFEFTEPGSGGKFLEEPLFGNMSKYKDIIGREIARALKG